MAQLHHKKTMLALFVGAALSLAGIYLAGVLLNGSLSTGDISGVMDKAGWFRVAGIAATLVSGLFFLRVAIRREWSGLAAKRVMAGIAALFVLAFLFIEWVPMVRRDNSMDVDKVLEQSREKLKEADSVMERIRSEMDEIASGPNLELKAKQPNTIYTNTVDGGLTLEHLISVEAKEEPKPDSQESNVVISLPEKFRVSKSNEKEFPDYFAYRRTYKLLDDELESISGGATVFSGDLAMWRRSALPLATRQSPFNDNKLAVLAVKVELLTYYKPFDRKKQDSWEAGLGDALDQSHFTPEIKAFVATLRDGESGEFDGWHYLKVDGAFSEESKVDE